MIDTKLIISLGSQSTRARQVRRADINIINKKGIDLREQWLVRCVLLGVPGHVPSLFVGLIPRHSVVILIFVAKRDDVDGSRCNFN